MSKKTDVRIEPKESEHPDILSFSEGKKSQPPKPIDLMPIIKSMGYPLTLAAVFAAHTALFFSGANRDKGSPKEPAQKTKLEALRIGQEFLNSKNDPRNR